MTLARIRTQWALATLALLALACQASDNSNLLIAGKCANSDTVVVLPTASRVAPDLSIDLNCDGFLDKFTVVEAAEGNTSNGFEVSFLGRRSRIPWDGDGSEPSLIAFGDVDKDGFRDALLAIVDESGVGFALLQIRSDSLWYATAAELGDWAAWNFVDESDGTTDACREDHLPQLRMLNGRVRISVAVRQVDPSDCSTVQRLWITIQEGHLASVRDTL